MELLKHSVTSSILLWDINCYEVYVCFAPSGGLHPTFYPVKDFASITKQEVSYKLHLRKKGGNYSRVKSRCAHSHQDRDMFLSYSSFPYCL